MKGLAETFFIVKITDKFDALNTRISNDIQIIDSYKNLARAQKHFREVVYGCREGLNSNEIVCMKDDYAVVINSSEEIRLHLTYDILKWI